MLDILPRTTDRRSARGGRVSTGDIAVDEPRLTVCMLAACPFPANRGAPGSIWEVSEAVAERSNEVHIETYRFGEEISVRGVAAPKGRVRQWEFFRCLLGSQIRR